MSERTRALTPPSLDEVAKQATITVEETAAVLGLGRSAAYEAVRRGDLPSRRLGRRIVIPVPALLTWLGVPEASSTVEG
jgi:excisionase family DNA binding protein